MIVDCQNKRIENNESVKVCEQFLADIPQCVVDSLKKHPGEKMTFRCRICPPYDRWIQVYFDKNGKSVWTSSDEKPDFSNKMKFDIVFNTEQVG